MKMNGSALADSFIFALKTGEKMCIRDRYGGCRLGDHRGSVRQAVAFCHSEARVVMKADKGFTPVSYTHLG